MHLRRLRQIRRRVGEEVNTRLVIALVISRLDYCNSLLAGLPLYNRTVSTRSERRCSTDIRTQSVRAHHTKPTPVTLATHSWRVQFKLCCFMHAVVTGRCPAYLGSIVQPATQSRSGLRPSSSNFSVPQGPSSASGPSLTPTRLRGTHCRAISAKQSIPLV